MTDLTCKSASGVRRVNSGVSGQGEEVPGLRAAVLEVAVSVQPLVSLAAGCRWWKDVG